MRSVIEPHLIQEKVEQALPGAKVAVHDLTGSRDHYRLTIVASQFEGLLMIKQHKMIYEILDSDMEAKGGGIHALSLVTYTPEQWEEEKGKQ